MMDDNPNDPMELSSGLRRQAAQRWINEASYIPKDVAYDFLPLCEALVEPFVDISDASVPPPAKRVGDSRVLKDAAGQLLEGEPDSGGQDYVRYVPYWMDPDYNENVIETPNGTRKRNVSGDALFKLRPALRLTDQFRNPTAYAQRFGIAEGRLDGRSRMSPTWSKTRDPLDDLVNQVSLLDDKERGEAVRQSREMYKQENTMPTPGQNIHPKVMQNMLAQKGLLSNNQLSRELQKGAIQGSSLDAMVAELEQKHPGIRRAHQVYLDNALQDQDYQRILLNGLTADELVQNNIREAGSLGKMELDNDIHYLFTREKWRDSKGKGSKPHSPRYLYSINGTREEWDVTTNDALWHALQPALRLVSQVLEINHPQIEAIYNMATRTRIPPAQDLRRNKGAETLTKYALEKDIDLGLTYDELRRLHEQGYDWKTNVLKTVLDKYLRLDIGSCSVAPGYSSKHKNGVEEWEPWGYGATDRHDEGDAKDCRIDITIGAEMIWPLLVPQYTQTEKMTCSFVIANTILHEFAHAIHHAQVLLATKDWIQPPGQDPAITNLLFSVRGKVFDLDSGPGEPFFHTSPDMELGFDVEEALWGFFPCSPIVQGRGISKDLETFPFAVYAVSLRPRRGEILRSSLETGISFARPLPKDFIENLFNKAFWTSALATKNHAALQMLPEGPWQMMPQGRILKCLAYDQETSVVPGNQVYGEKAYSHIRAVSEILVNSRHHVLGVYLRALVDEVPRPLLYLRRWQRETRSWGLGPLLHSTTLLFDKVRETNYMHRQQTAQDKDRFYSAYRNRRRPYGSVVMSEVEWTDNLNSDWTENFRNGGLIMQRLLDAHTQMQRDLSHVQLMVFDYLTLSPEHRSYLHGRDLASRPGSEIAVVEAHLTSFRGVAQRIATFAGNTGKKPQLAADRVRWERWQADFTKNAAQYQELLSAIGNAAHTHPDDMTWKIRFTRVPTANWRPPHLRYTRMAEREYGRAAPAVQKAYDHCINLIKTKGSLAPRVDLPTQAEIQEIQDALARLPRFDPTTGDLLTIPQQSVFNTALRTNQTSTPPSRTRTSPGPRSTTPGNSPFRFGVPGVRPPRRMPRVHKPESNARRGSAYQDEGYMVNRLAAAGTEGDTDFFQSGIPQPIINLLPRQVGASEARRRGGLIIPPFPDPYASRVMLTSEARALEEQRRLAEEAARTANNASGAYTAPQLWQTRRPNSDSDSSP